MAERSRAEPDAGSCGERASAGAQTEVTEPQGARTHALMDPFVGAAGKAGKAGKDPPAQRSRDAVIGPQTPAQQRWAEPGRSGDLNVVLSRVCTRLS